MIEILKSFRAAMIVTSEPLDIDVDQIVWNRTKAIKDAVTYLISKGRKNIAHCGLLGPQSSSNRMPEQYKADAFLACLKEHIFTYWFCLGCTALLVVVFVTGTIYNLLFKFSDSQWAIFWKYFMYLIMVLGTILAFWISLGGLVEMPSFFARLRNSKRDDSDDGQVKVNNDNKNLKYAANDEKSSVVLEK